MTGQESTFDLRRARRRILLLSIVLFAMVTLVMLTLIQLYGFESVHEGWDVIAPAVIAIKWGGMAVLIWQWDSFVRWIAQRQRMGDDYRDYLLGMRWRVAIALVILEVLFGQNLLAYLLN